MNRRSATFAIALVALAVNACSGAAPTYKASGEVVAPPGPPVPLEVTKPFFVPGEQMDWRLSLRGVVGGHAQLAVGQPGKIGDHNLIITRSRVESTGVVALLKKVSDDVKTWIDVDEGVVKRMEAELRFGKKQSRVEVEFFRGGYNMLYHRHGRLPHRWRQRLPAGLVAHEAHSIMAMLRAWRPTTNSKAYFFAVGGRRIWYNVVEYKGSGTVLTAMGRRHAVRIDGVARRLYRSLRFNKKKKPRYYTLWVSDDDQRLPLLLTAKTEYGLVKVELVGYRPPNGAATDAPSPL